MIDWDAALNWTSSAKNIHIQRLMTGLARLGMLAAFSTAFVAAFGLLVAAFAVSPPIVSIFVLTPLLAYYIGSID